MQRFSSTDKYIATDGLIEAVNASITLEKPLLIKGEPGTGKTKLAEEIAQGSVDLGYIFESPDGGKTIFKRKVGEEKREQVTKKQWKEYNRNR